MMIENLELERSLIGCFFRHKKDFDLALDMGVVAEDFSDRDYRDIFKVMTGNYTIDVIGVLEALNGNQNDVIRDCVDGYVSSVPLKHWIRLLQEKSQLRKLNNLAEEIPSIVGSDETLESKIDKINSKLLENKIVKTTGTPKKAKEVLADLANEVTEAGEEKKNVIKTHFTDIDRKLHGFKKGDLVIIAGRPAMGKTTFALNIATKNLLAGKTVLVFSLEMTNNQLMKKMVSSQAGIDMSCLMNGKLSEKQWESFGEQRRVLGDTDFYIYDKSPITIETLVNKTKTVHAHQKVDLIVIDYLQLLMTSSKIPQNSDSRTASMTYISNILKGLAKEVYCPVIALSQLNRGVEGRNDKRPVLSDLRDSGSIEQDADFVLMLYRQEYYDSSDPGLAEVICRKNRMGETGTFELLFEGSLSRFVDPGEAAFGHVESYVADKGPI